MVKVRDVGKGLGVKSNEAWVDSQRGTKETRERRTRKRVTSLKAKWR